MNFKLIIFFSIVLLIVLNKVSAQVVKKDTIYYLVDTSHTSLADRMITVETGAPYRFYTINCPCLKDNVEPVFRSNVTMSTYMDRKVFKSLKLISLPDLIRFVKTNDNKEFDHKHVIFFIEPYSDKFAKNKVFFQGGGIERNIDNVTVHTDTSKNKKP